MVSLFAEQERFLVSVVLRIVVGELGVLVVLVVPLELMVLEKLVLELAFSVAATYLGLVEHQNLVCVGQIL